MGGGGKIGDPKDMATGAFLQCVEAASLGMPFEVWKTRMGRFRNEGNAEAIRAIIAKDGVGGFWKGTSAKMVESATKGAILLYAKEAILQSMEVGGFSPGFSGICAGAGGGLAQVSVMGPCTFLVTAVVTGKDVSVMKKASEVWAAQGIKGFYPGGVALAFRQSSNWASRQGFTEIIRDYAKSYRAAAGSDFRQHKLSKTDEALCGLSGGILSTWNQPFEVARIQAQAAASEGKPSISMAATMKNIVAESGMTGLYKGIVPRMCLGAWQTLFMVTGAKIVKEKIDMMSKSH